MSDNEEPMPHPDKILDDAASIIEGATQEAETLALFRAHQPSVVLAGWMLDTLIKAGFSRESAEEMVLLVWTRYYSVGYGVWEYDEDDDD